MKRFKITKGEWISYPNGEIVSKNSNCVIAESVQKESDRSLIAASPELLKFALFIAKHEKGCAPSCGYFQEMIEKAESVINKALGEK